MRRRYRSERDELRPYRRRVAPSPALSLALAAAPPALAYLLSHLDLAAASVAAFLALALVRGRRAGDR